jgi:hypothetical protein
VEFNQGHRKLVADLDQKKVKPVPTYRATANSQQHTMQPTAIIQVTQK